MSLLPIGGLRGGWNFYDFVAFGDCFGTDFQVVLRKRLLRILRVHSRIGFVDGMQHTKQSVRDDSGHSDEQCDAHIHHPVRRCERNSCRVFRELGSQKVDGVVVHRECQERVGETEDRLGEKGSPVLLGPIDRIVVRAVEVGDHLPEGVVDQRVQLTTSVVQCYGDVDPRDEHPQGGAENALEVAQHFPNCKELLDCHAYLQRKGIEKITGMMKPNAKAAVTSLKLLLPDIHTHSIRTKTTPHKIPPASIANNLGNQG